MNLQLNGCQAFICSISHYYIMTYTLTFITILKTPKFLTMWPINLSLLLVWWLEKDPISPVRLKTSSFVTSLTHLILRIIKRHHTSKTSILLCSLNLQSMFTACKATLLTNTNPNYSQTLRLIFLYQNISLLKKNFPWLRNPTLNFHFFLQSLILLSRWQNWSAAFSCSFPISYILPHLL